MDFRVAELNRIKWRTFLLHFLRSCSSWRLYDLSNLQRHIKHESTAGTRTQVNPLPRFGPENATRMSTSKSKTHRSLWTIIPIFSLLSTRSWVSTNMRATRKANSRRDLKAMARANLCYSIHGTKSWLGLPRGQNAPLGHHGMPWQINTTLTGKARSYKSKSIQRCCLHHMIESATSP